MAKGDHPRVASTVEYQGGNAQNRLNNVWDNLYPQNQGFFNNYNSGVSRNFGDYDTIMNNYQNFFNKSTSSGGSGSGSGIGGLSRQGEINESLAGYKDFSKTGGFTPQGIQDIRARAIAPTRAVYSNMQNEMGRQKSLQGGYSPNFMAASAKMARQGAQTIGDMNVNANAGIAQMIQQGRLAGLGGLSQTALADQGQALQRGIAGASNATANRGLDLQALQGMTGLYGTNPGLSNVFGNQLINSSGQLLGAQGLQNQLAQLMINGQLGMAQVPGNFQAGLGNVAGTLGVLGQVGGILGGMGGGSNMFGGMRGGVNTGITGGGSPIGQVNFPSLPSFSGIQAVPEGANALPGMRF